MEQREDDCNVHNFDKRLILVEYPGVVQNEDKAIRTLGGLQNISTVSDKIRNNMWSNIAFVWDIEDTTLKIIK